MTAAQTSFKTENNYPPQLRFPESALELHQLGRELCDLAFRVDRLSPSNHYPETFFVERDEIRAELRRIAAECDPRPRLAPNPRSKFNAGPTCVDGRVVRVEIREIVKRKAAKK